MIYIGLILIVVNQAPAAGQQPGEPLDSGQDVTCERCGWNGQYRDTATAKQALGAHRRFCQRRTAAAADVYSNPFRDRSPLFASGRVITAGVTRATCQRCGWTREYDTPTNASRGLSSHQYSCRQNERLPGGS